MLKYNSKLIMKMKKKLKLIMKKQSKGKTIIKIKATKKLNLNNKKSPEPQLIANNQLLGQPKSTPGPAFVQYKLNGKNNFQ